MMEVERLALVGKTQILIFDHNVNTCPTNFGIAGKTLGLPPDWV